MWFFKLVLTLILFFSFVACSSHESKLESILDWQIGKTRIIEKTRLELDSMLGEDDSKLKDSILDYVSDHVDVRYSDMLIEGKKARVKVIAVVPKMYELNTLLLLAGFLPRETMLQMTIGDVLLELSKKTRRPASEFIKNETYEFIVNFEKNKNWSANPDQLSNAFGKRNLISKRYPSPKPSPRL